MGARNLGGSISSAVSVADECLSRMSMHPEMHMTLPPNDSIEFAVVTAADDHRSTRFRQPSDDRI